MEYRVAVISVIVEENGDTNALMTLAEFLVDYASEDTKKVGWALIEKELAKIPKDNVREVCANHIEEIKNSNSRDFRF